MQKSLLQWPEKAQSSAPTSALVTRSGTHFCKHDCIASLCALQQVPELLTIDGTAPAKHASTHEEALA